MSSALLQAQALVNADRLDDAETILRDHLKGLPNSPVALQGLGLIELKRERLRPARTLMERSSRFQPGNRISNHNLGIVLSQLGEHEEALVAEPEPAMREIIGYCGLPWDDACLEFHKTKRPVLTASAWQVRQPIYQGSIGRWRHYDKHLGPLLEALGEKGSKEAITG